MRLLIITQKIDRRDENLGFFCRWVEEFAKHATRVSVIASFVGEHNLPENVSVYSLGKERGAGKLMRRLRYWRLLLREWGRSDAVFFHMIPEAVLAAMPWLLAAKRRTAFWYVHKNVSFALRAAERFVDHVFTASSQSFRLPSKKVVYTGHAIDTGFFAPGPKEHRTNGSVSLLAAGRIAPVKDYETLIRAAKKLAENWSRAWNLTIVGGPLLERDKRYFETLKGMVAANNLAARVSFAGPRPYPEMPSVYREHDVLISLSGTGSIDKAVLEAMACGLTVLTSNEAFRDLLPPQYFLAHKSPEFISERVKALADEPRPNAALRAIVEERHGLANTIDKIVKTLRTPL